MGNGENDRALSIFFESCGLLNLQGAFTELGVYQGKTSLAIGKFIRRHQLEQVHYGFDTFCGYTSEDLRLSPHLDTEHQRTRWDWTEQAVRETLRKEQLDEICNIVVGDIKESVPEFAESMTGSIACVYIDCNAYLPAIVALRSLQSKFQKGTVLCVDEHQIGGETQALAEFCREHGIDHRQWDWKAHGGGPSSFSIW